jgi:hypothetical protein
MAEVVAKLSLVVGYRQWQAAPAATLSTDAAAAAKTGLLNALVERPQFSDGSLGRGTGPGE